jgi:uncharacterized protein YhaN
MAKADEIIQSIKEKIKDLDNQIHQKEIQLASLNVTPSDYHQEKVDESYKEEEYRSLQGEAAAVQSEIEQEHQELRSLKQQICQLTEDDITEQWPELIENLRIYRRQISEEISKITAEIIGKLMVWQTIQEIQKDEEATLLKGVQTDEVLRPLNRITGRYQDLYFDEDRLMVADSTDHFPLSELSTGAREQVLFSLRIGFSSRLLGQDQLFLLLDDAFQYSDWQRREDLLDMIVDLAKTGWQIIYFSMDDHIRSLFQKKGKGFNQNFRILELDDQSGSSRPMQTSLL